MSCSLITRHFLLNHYGKALTGVILTKLVKVMDDTLTNKMNEIRELMDLKGFKKDPKPNIYNPDFKEKANAFKKLGGTCSCCHGKFDLNYLEVHHKNRLKYDDRPENWEVLCVTCHIQEHRSDNPRMLALYTSNNRLADFSYLIYIRR